GAVADGRGAAKEPVLISYGWGMAVTGAARDARVPRRDPGGREGLEMRDKRIRLAVVGGKVGAGCALADRSACDVGVGRPAPPTEGVDADGVPFSLADYSGRVVMVSFWGNF